MVSLDSFGSRATLTIDGRAYGFFRIDALATLPGNTVARLPVSLKVLLENLLRNEDGAFVKRADIEALARWNVAAPEEREIAFRTARVLLQDFTGVPAVVDLAALRDAIAQLGGDPARINPLQPVDLVIDHSVQVDAYGSDAAFLINAKFEFERNQERYALLRWAQTAFRNFRVVPPDTGIVHQVNLEYLASVVFTAPPAGSSDGEPPMAYPDSLVGTDSHTTMINGLGVVGWGVGGIEAEAAMLGQPLSMLVPDVVGFRLHGKLPVGATATDLVLTVTQMLRQKKVVGKFVEFFGDGLSTLSLADRATIANMAPEYGATIGLFPIDAETLAYLRLTGRDEQQVRLVEAYAKAQGIFRTDDTPDPLFGDSIALDLATVEPSIAGPRRPQDRIPLVRAKAAVQEALAPDVARGTPPVPVDLDGKHFTLTHGAVAIAAITSCTNTSNPSVMVAAGLLARKAFRAGLSTQPWVKTSLAPGSKVVTEYLRAADLLNPLAALGFSVIGYGCTTCIGNSGPLPQPIADAVEQHNLTVASVLSGNRNFEGRINPHTRFSYLASPPLVVAYALAGRVDIDFATEPVGTGSKGPVFLRDIWPSPQEVGQEVARSVRREMFTKEYADVFVGDARWQSLPVPTGDRYTWDPASTYVKHPPYFDDMTRTPPGILPIAGARALVMLGDSITTDHISPAGSIAAASPAGQWLIAHGVARADFNSYGARRGHDEVMVRGTFANIRLRNELVPGVEGWWTAASPGEKITIYNAALAYARTHTPLVVVAGKEYGSGSSRDWAAKGTRLLGVRAVIAESFERIHRANLVGMGVLPLELEDGATRQSLGLTGFETFDIDGLTSDMPARARLTVRVHASDGAERRFTVRSRIDTPEELNYYRHGGILPYVVRQLAAQTETARP